VAVERTVSYAILQGNTPPELQQRVIGLCQQGFLPTGGVAVVGTDPRLVGGVVYLQAMVLIHEREIPDSDAPVGPRPLAT